MAAGSKLRAISPLDGEARLISATIAPPEALFQRAQKAAALARRDRARGRAARRTARAACSCSSVAAFAAKIFCSVSDIDVCYVGVGVGEAGVVDGVGTGARVPP